MAVERMRGCGYRIVGGTYIVGSAFFRDCDRLPYPLNYCPTCGAGIKFSRNFQWIDAVSMFGIHEDCRCIKEYGECHMCAPVQDVSYGIMWVGEASYSPESFMLEAKQMGISKRIPFIPKELKIGKTVILLAHKNAVEVSNVVDGKLEFGPGIFCVFQPTAIERLYWQSELTDDVAADCYKQGVTPISIPDDDADHVKPSEVELVLDSETLTFGNVIRRTYSPKESEDE